MMTNPDAHVSVGGDIYDYEGVPNRLRRQFDLMDVPSMTITPAGVRVMEKAIAAWWNDLARYRLRTVELYATGIDVSQCREDLAAFPGAAGDPDDLESVDWNEVGRRLDALKRQGGYRELRKLHALLTADNVQAGGRRPLTAVGHARSREDGPVDGEGSDLD